MPFRLMMHEMSVADPHAIPNTLPEGPNSTDFHLSHRSPFILPRPRNRLGDEHTQGVQKVGIGEFAGLLVPGMNIVHTSNSLNGPL